MDHDSAVLIKGAVDENAGSVCEALQRVEQQMTQVRGLLLGAAIFNVVLLAMIYSALP